MNEVLIGGQLVPQQSFEAMANISSNRTLLALKLTNEPPGNPEPVPDLKTVEEVFNHFKPKGVVEFENAEGVPVKEEFHFQNLGDFRKEGIIEKSSFLKSLSAQSDNYKKFAKQLRVNKPLKTALNDPETRKAYLQAVQAMIQEIDNADQ